MEIKSDYRQKSRARWIITSTVTVLAVIISLYCFSLMRKGYPGMHAGFYFAVLLSLLLIVYLALWSLCAHRKFSRPARILRSCYLICLSAGIICFIVLQIFIISGAYTEDEDVDCVVILGAGIIGEVPSSILTSRLNAAVDYLKTRDSIPVIVSGGQGPGETITEAEAMYRYLVRRGIDGERIWKEDSSTSTFENLSFSRALMEEQGLDAENAKVAVVSNEFHLFRAKLIAESTGLYPIGIAAETPHLGMRLLYFCREAFALASHLLFNDSIRFEQETPATAEHYLTVVAIDTRFFRPKIARDPVYS